MNENLADLVRDAAGAAPERVALIAVSASGTAPKPEQRLTWAELDARVDALATGLRAGGLETGDRVLLLQGNGLPFPISYFGVLRAGGVAVPVNTGYTAKELGRVLADAQPRVVLCDPDRHQALAEAVAESAGTDLRVVTTDSAEFAALTAPGGAPGQPHRYSGGDDLALLMYTAGTSGEPRAAMLTHRALRTNVDQWTSQDPAPMTGDDVCLVVLPLFHVYALNSALGGVARTGATALLVDRFDPEQTLRLVREYAVTSIPGVPAMYAAWVNREGIGEALAGVRLLVSGAAPMPLALLTQWTERTGKRLYEGYGLTEAAPVVASNIGPDGPKAGSVGQPLPGIEVRLVDADGEEVDEGDPGEVLVRGANLFSGYWPDGTEGPNAEGWYATGDVAYLDEDGDLFLVDRRKELILVNGFNVYPSEVEEALAAHPGVGEAAVIGVPHQTRGEAVKAYVVPRDQVPAALTVDELTKHCLGRLARFKCPTEIEIVARLPRSTTGKVAKGQLRARDWQRALDQG